MIDIIFLLLIYFFLSTTLAPPESRLSPALRAERRDAGSSADLQPQVVEVARIGGSPGFRLGGRVLRGQEALTEALRDLPKEIGVFVRVSDGVTARWPAAALQACRDAGFGKVTYVPASGGGGV